MAHENVNEIYLKLGRKIDGTTTRTPWNKALFEILKALYTTREAELLVKMPYGISRLEQIEHSVKFDQTELLGLLEVSQHGFPNTVVTSTIMAYVDTAKCSGCEKCAQTCPINAISMTKYPDNGTEEHFYPMVNESICIGCGVCGLSCANESIKLVKREQRVLHLETIFERLILASLERGTLQNQFFNDPQKINHKFLRGFLGGFLRIPSVKQALMSDTLRSRFLTVMKADAQKKNSKH
jgi:ferredoxin